jgi:heme/copper-type cytochrome/quinol oxidase subunit 2
MLIFFGIVAIMLGCVVGSLIAFANAMNQEEYVGEEFEESEAVEMSQWPTVILLVLGVVLISLHVWWKLL